MGVAGDFIGIHTALSAIHSTFLCCHTAFPDLAMSQISGNLNQKNTFLTAFLVTTVKPTHVICVFFCWTNRPKMRKSPALLGEKKYRKTVDPPLPNRCPSKDCALDMRGTLKLIDFGMSKSLCWKVFGKKCGMWPFFCLFP